MPPAPTVKITESSPFKKPTKIVISEDKDMDFILGLIAEIHNEFKKDNILQKDTNVEVIIPYTDETITTPLTGLKEIITEHRLQDVGRIDIKFNDVLVCVTGNPYDTMKAQGFSFSLINASNGDYTEELINAKNVQIEILEELKKIEPNFSTLQENIITSRGIKKHYEELPEQLKKGLAYLKEYYESSNITSEFTEKNLPTPELVNLLEHFTKHPKDDSNESKYLAINNKCNKINKACSENPELLTTSIFNKQDMPAISILDNNVNRHYYFNGLITRNAQLAHAYAYNEYSSPIICASSEGDNFMREDEKRINFAISQLNRGNFSFENTHIAFEKLNEPHTGIARKPAAQTWEKVKEVLGFGRIR